MEQGEQMMSDPPDMRSTLRLSDGEEIGYDVYLPGPFPEPLPIPLPITIVAHGFKGFKEWGFFPYAGRALADAGMAVIVMNFSHNGLDPHGEEFTRPERFATNTFTREIRELREMIDAVEADRLGLGERVDRTSIATVGHSRGGGIVLLEAANDPRLRGVVTWSAVSTFDRYSRRQIEMWRREGQLEVINARTGQVLQLDKCLLEDLERNSEKLDIRQAVKTLDRPLLIVHGEVDLTVPPSNAVDLHSAASNSQSELVRVPRTGHTFGAVHPFAGPTEALRTVIDTTVAFLQSRVFRPPPYAA